MTDQDTRAAAKALISWFKSQDLRPRDALLVMASTIGYMMKYIFTECDDPLEAEAFLDAFSNDMRKYMSK